MHISAIGTQATLDSKETLGEASGKIVEVLEVVKEIRAKMVTKTVE